MNQGYFDMFLAQPRGIHNLKFIGVYSQTPV